MGRHITRISYRSCVFDARRGRGSRKQSEQGCRYQGQLDFERGCGGFTVNLVVCTVDFVVVGVLIDICMVLYYYRY